MTQFTLELMRMAWPTAWSEIYGRSAPLIIEIGFGNGRFLLDQARQHPASDYLGIEIARPSLRRAANRVRAAGVANVRLIRASAQSALQLLCRPGSVQGVTINFPDPWPKVAHNDRRLISTTFLELLASRMAVGADLDIATDHVDYGQWIAEHLRASSYFESRLATAYMRQDTERLRTKYEKKGLAAGSAYYYFKWRRNTDSAPDGYRLVEELPMPHVVVRSPLTLREIAGHFEPQQRATGAVAIRYIDLYQSQRRPSLIVDTYIAEEPLDQRLMLEIYRRPDADYLIRLQATGFPRPTAGVHAAIAGLTDWLLSLPGQARVVRHNLNVWPAVEEGEA
ncbi:MAG: tRNA (guanosine(46)-N7)-methyltransferase TrmB [Candidatus Promineifilaceae bacterium]